MSRSRPTPTAKKIPIRFDESVFNHLYLGELYNNAPIQVAFGGAGSGKSRFYAQRDVIDLLRGGRNFLITRQIARTTRKSVFNEIESVINTWGMGKLFKINKTDATVTCIKNGHQIAFVGLDDPDKVKSITPAIGNWTDVRMEEATESSEVSFDQLELRQRGNYSTAPKRITLLFNPVLKRHWIYDRFFRPISWADDQRRYASADLTILKSTHWDNRFLTAEDHAKIENQKSEYMRQVYALGNWGVLGNVIFTNWESADLSGMRDQFTNNRYGLDFGFSVHPSALVASHYDTQKETIYIYDGVYGAEMNNDLLSAACHRIAGRNQIAADSAEPRTINELRRLGVAAYPVKKGGDSIVHGIEWLGARRIIVDRRLTWMIDELSSYERRKGHGGDVLLQPIDKNNHAIDALRYAYEQDMIAARGGDYRVAASAEKFTGGSGFGR